MRQTLTAQEVQGFGAPETQREAFDRPGERIEGSREGF